MIVPIEKTVFNYKDNCYAERLVREWLTHGKIVLAVDFDDTLKGWSLHNDAMQNRVIAIIKKAREVGIYLSIWSACDESRKKEINDYLLTIGLQMDSFNENPISLPYGNFKKMYYNHLLDDRSGLNEAINILEYCCYRVEYERKAFETKNFDI
jgi:hypothetical protein